VKAEDFDFCGSRLLGLVDFGCVRNCAVFELSILCFLCCVDPECGSCVFVNGDLMLLSFRLFVFLLPFS